MRAPSGLVLWTSLEEEGRGGTKGKRKAVNKRGRGGPTVREKRRGRETSRTRKEDIYRGALGF